MTVQDLIDLCTAYEIPTDTEIASDSDDCAGRLFYTRICTDMQTGELVIVLGGDREAIDIEDHPGYE